MFVAVQLFWGGIQQPSFCWRDEEEGAGGGEEDGAVELLVAPATCRAAIMETIIIDRSGLSGIC